MKSSLIISLVVVVIVFVIVVVVVFFCHHHLLSLLSLQQVDGRCFCNHVFCTSFYPSSAFLIGVPRRRPTLTLLSLLSSYYRCVGILFQFLSLCCSFYRHCHVVYGNYYSLATLRAYSSVIQVICIINTIIKHTNSLTSFDDNLSYQYYLSSSSPSALNHRPSSWSQILPRTACRDCCRQNYENC